MASAEPTAKAGWEVKSLGDLCDIARGGSPRPIQSFLTEADNGINWIKIGDATASEKYIYETKQKIKPEGISRSRMVEPGDFLLSNSMSFGRPYIMKTTGCIHDGWLVLSDKSGEFDPDFLYHYLGSQHAYRQFDGLAAGSTVRNLNIDLVRKVTIPVPPLAEQERIVGILDEAFEGIAAATAQAEKNLHNARELFQSVLQSTFSQKGDDWVEKQIGEVCNLMTGGTPSRKKLEYFDEGSVKWLVSGDIHQKEIHDCEGRITQLGIDNSNAKYLPLNSVMIALNGQGKTRGSVAILRTKATCNQSLVSIFPNDISQILPEYIYTNLHGRYEEIRRITGDDGNDRRGLNMPLVRNIEIPIPPLPTQQAIVEKLDALSEETKALEAIYECKKAALSELKQSLLQKAFAGEL